MLDEDKLLSLFYKYARVMFGDVDFDSIEEALKPLRSGGFLNYDYLEIIENGKWPFKEFWRWPCRRRLEPLLADEKIALNRLPEGEVAIITDLQRIFKNIALVSIILRFVWPEYYGIYSPPTLKLLRIKRAGNWVDEYMNYLEVIRLLSDSFQIDAAAKVDMITWGVFYDNDYETKKEFFRRWLGEWIPENLAPEDLIKYMYDNSLRIANYYFEHGDYKTAGKWAAQALEEFMRKNGKLKTDQRKYRSKPGGGELTRRTKAFWQRNYAVLRKNEINKGVLDNLIKLRNYAVHARRKFRKRDAEEMIEVLKKLKTINYG